MPEALPFMKGTVGIPSVENLHAYWNETMQRSMDLAGFIQKRSEHFHRSITEAHQERTSETASENWIHDAVDYLFDTGQRSVLFMDILRKRGNIFLETSQKGQRPVLTFDYKIILEGKSLPRPVNHDLAQIIPEKEETTDPGKRPIVVIDPRAGHGPGIGGSKQDSEIGMALKHGHPVYFILFYPDPEAGQTYADVKDAQARFVEEVRIRHPHAEEPALIGNCQAGWAVALLSADRPDITGPLVLNGSPLSYWSGVDGQNPMR